MTDLFAWVCPHRNDLPHSTFRLRYEICPLLKCRTPLLEIVMAVIRPLDTTKLVPQAALRHFRANAQRSKMRACCAPQIVQSEVR